MPSMVNAFRPAGGAPRRRLSAAGGHGCRPDLRVLGHPLLSPPQRTAFQRASMMSQRPKSVIGQPREPDSPMALLIRLLNASASTARTGRRRQTPARASRISWVLTISSQPISIKGADPVDRRCASPPWIWPSTGSSSTVRGSPGPAWDPARAGSPPHLAS